jgi:hypothetical protein
MAKTSGGVRSRVRGGGNSSNISANYPDIQLSVFSGNFPEGLNALKAIQLTGLMKDFNGNVQVEPYGDTVRVSVEGNGLRMDRTIRTLGGDKYISNNYFKIGENSIYAGKSLEIFSNQVKNAAKSGYSRIEVMAAGSPNDGVYNGYYTWAAYGYKPNNSNTLVNNIAVKTGRNYNNWESMMKSKQGRADWKSYGQGWSGSFDLTKGSNSLKQLGYYTKDKKTKS